MRADVRGAVERRARLHGFGWCARQLPAELLFDGGEEFLEPPGIQHIFQPRLVAIGAVAVLDEHAHDRIGEFRRILRSHDYAGVARNLHIRQGTAAIPAGLLDLHLLNVGFTTFHRI